MKNADIPAMPLTGDAYTDINGTAHSTGTIELGTGLTKREYIAAKLMQGFCSNPEMNLMDSMDVARAAVSYADSLLKALN